ncbi:MAG TPA: class I SAM-dependent methyltransferase [Mycobacteriales bacterium]|nr:class I SAM-dependent methyltransferase [Mycobacteriales bacterium]
MVTREEAERRQLYDARHALATHEATRVVEAEAVGTDYGNAGFTTRAQADLLADLLELKPTDRLLDVGSGAGWPGLYLAGRSGCSVVVSDISDTGMVQARRRAAADGMSDRARAVVATARQLPFRPEQFDAIVHTDVLC